ncbi:MAG: ABC transporter ATP-binding protein [Beijerinckiaceae bacterium]|nr:ABC transporter ATP-binding protein [Beijerinckiaceae bacterium]
MSSDVVISCEHVGKAFQLYLRRNDQLKQALFGPWKQFYHPHWVLRDISFKVRRGERIGIVGRNGAGKTTLLQVICGITLPTHGMVHVKGQVAPILALGAGFDHELTGRENALIGGAILGMRRATIEARLAAIAAFADIGDFFHQPVKLYSSGMAARLAFAVCAHADADILIVDEALSVGDAAFGRKCDAFIKGFASHGTILVVSHDLATLESLCDRVIWIEDGVARGIGPAAEIIASYRAAIEGKRKATASAPILTDTVTL